MNECVSEDMIRTDCVVLGAEGVGKSSLIKACLSDMFSIKDKIPKIVIEEGVALVRDDRVIMLHFHDTPGQWEKSELSDQMRKLWKTFNLAHIFVVCFSLVNRHSYRYVKKTIVPELKLFRKRTKKDVPLILIGTQEDLRTDPEIIAKLAERFNEPLPGTKGKKLAKRLNATCYLECSVVTSKGLNLIEDQIAAIAIEKFKNSGNEMKQ